MTNAVQHSFSHAELLEILLKNAGIHEGLWILSINFGLSATNMSNSNDGVENLRPCVMAFVENFGLLRVERELKGLTLDAAVVNPLAPGLTAKPAVESAGKKAASKKKMTAK
jgi:hypothetical protein